MQAGVWGPGVRSVRVARLIARCSSRLRSTVKLASSPSWSLSDAGRRAASPVITHEVTNQATPLSDFNAYSCDPSLLEAVEQHKASWASEHLSSFGLKTGSTSYQQAAREANVVVPRLVTHDRFGHRVDRAEYHPAYHQLMRLALENGCASFAWGEHEGKVGAHPTRATLMYLMYQLERRAVHHPRHFTLSAALARSFAPSHPRPDTSWTLSTVAVASAAR